MALASTASAGDMTTMPGMERMRAKSSRHWWEAPSSPTEMPPWEAPIFTFSLG